MTSITRCPECNGQLQVPEEFFGRKVKCPTCGAQFTASGEASTPAPTPQTTGRQWDDDAEDDFDDDPRPRRRRRPRGNYQPHRGSTILVLGILSIVLCTPLGPFAWIMGSGDLQKIRAGTMDPEGEGLTKAGYICGIIGSVLLIFHAIYFGFLAFVLFSAKGGPFRM